ncbi:hypothetical protein [Mucilaginibacter sp. CSA2-8R]|uniref:hypothetical protein n=1 Tax=Mucilaginibacter sp. CSA2-8R TaxID=3141542 RepID=UPI00315C72C9
MNNTKKLLMVCLLFSAAMVSCGKKPQEELVKTWQVNGVETETKLPESVKNAIIANSKLTFTKDGKYTTTGGIGADQGTYVLDSDGKNLSTTSTAGKSNEQYAVKKLDKDNLVLINKGNTVTCIAVN